MGRCSRFLDRTGEIKQEKRRQTLVDNRENALISLQLVTLKNDVPVEDEVEAFSCRCPEKEKLTAFIDRYGMNSLRARAEKWLSERCSRFAEGDENQQQNTVFKSLEKKYELITDQKALENWAAKIKNAGLFAFDTETTGLNPVFDKIVGLVSGGCPRRGLLYSAVPCQRSQGRFVFLCAGERNPTAAAGNSFCCS